MYIARIQDRLNSIPDKKSKAYATYKEAHEAATKLAKKHFTENRYNIDVLKIEKE